MKIGVGAHPLEAVGWLRGAGPAQFLASRGHAPALLVRHNGLSDDELRQLVREADVVHFVAPGGHFEDAPREIHERSGALTVDLDDDVWSWLEDEAAPTRPDVNAERVAALETWLLAADLVTTTTDALAATIRERLPRVRDVVVAPNALPPEARPRELDRPARLARRRRERGRRVIGWTGGRSHVLDLEPVLEATKRVLLSPVSLPFHVQVRTLGPFLWSRSETWDRDPRLVEHYRPATIQLPDGRGGTSLPLLEFPWPLYYDGLAALEASVALIPLDPRRPINEAKSAITLHSWAALGVPVICARTGPYAVEEAAGFPAVFVDHGDVGAWVDAIRDLLVDRVKAEALAERASAWVWERNAFPEAAGSWELVFERAVANKNRRLAS